MVTQNPSLETLQDIKRIMERSSCFISLSGLSGLSTGICAQAGAYFAHTWIDAHGRTNAKTRYAKIEINLPGLFGIGRCTGIRRYFTRRGANKKSPAHLGP